MAKMFVENELDSALLGPAALNPFQANTSASRGQMFSASHLGQMLVINGATERGVQTGMEREYGKYTFKIAMPDDGKILEIIPRYQATLGQDSIDENPETVVIYENVETKEIGIVRLVDYSCNHQYFGFRYVDRPGINELRVGNFIRKGTVFRDSPSISDEGGYKYGIQANVAYMTHPATAEDGVVVSDRLLPSLGFKTYETRVLDFGKKEFALNLYGTEERYQCWPDLGQPVRADGLLAAMRSFEPEELAIVNRSRRDCMEVDYTFDRKVYVNGPGGRVVDIKIHHDVQDYNAAKIHMDGQAQKYDRSRRVYYNRIIEAHNKLKRSQGDALQITPEFHSLVREALSVTKEGEGTRVQKQHRKAPLDMYRVEITVEYDIVPGVGFKLTDCHGGKMSKGSSILH